MNFIIEFLEGLAGLFSGVLILFMLAPFFKSKLMNDPDDPDKAALFTEVEPGRAKVKMRGGRYVGTIRGSNEAPLRDEAANWIWWQYQRYVWALIGMHVIGIPFIQKIYTYKLPRYRVIEVAGKKEFRVVPEQGPGYRTDHVRNELTTWYFQFSGAEVDTIPFTVKGSVQIRIKRGGERKALFGTDSWNVLLDQALNSVIRGIMRSEVTLDQIIGFVNKDIWADATATHDDTYEFVRNALETGLANYKITTPDGEKSLLALIDLSIERVDIIDFSPDLEGAELSKLSAPAIARQAARARSIAGTGEAENQKQVLAAVASFQELAKENIWAEAFVKAAGSGSLDALAAGFVKKTLGK